MIKCMRAEVGDESDLKRPDKKAERKFDGTRILIEKKADKVTVQNKLGRIYTVKLPDVVSAASNISEDYIVDAEAVYINSDGEEDFTSCQRRCATEFPAPFLIKQFPITAEAFDILMLNGVDLTLKPYLERKAILQKLLADYKGSFEYVPYMDDCLEAWAEIKTKDREGLMLKTVDGRYEQCYPKRSYAWLKIKNWKFEECEVVGFTEGENARRNFFGSLVLSKDGKFRGCVGSGFNDWELRQIKDMLTDAERIPRPFEIGEPYTAVTVPLKVKVRYYKITKQSKVMRFPIFQEIVK